MKKWLFVFLCVCFLSQCLSSTVLAEDLIKRLPIYTKKG